LAKKAKEFGCQAVVLCPPYYYPASEAVLTQHFELVADSVDIPIIIYNIPMFSTPISNKVVCRLSEKYNIVGMKDSGGNMVDLMHYIDVICRNGSGMNVLTGREDTLAPALTIGVKGCMTACAGIFPEIMVGIWDSYHAGDWEKAKRLQFALLPVIREMFAAPFPIGFKAAMEFRGFAMGPLMQPLSIEEEKNLIPIKTRIQLQIHELLELIEREGLGKKK
jgi:dihydrodipicolinate synthase/N-acetylneuraminate lyase